MKTKKQANLNGFGAKGLIILLIFGLCIGVADAANFNSGVSVNLEKTIDLNEFSSNLKYEIKEQSNNKIVFKFSSGDYGYVYSNGIVKVGSTEEFSLATKDILEREIVQIVNISEIFAVSEKSHEYVCDHAIYYAEKAGMFKRIKSKGHCWIDLKLLFPDCSIKEGRVIIRYHQGYTYFKIDGDYVIGRQSDLLGDITKYLTPGIHDVDMECSSSTDLTTTYYIEAYTTPCEKSMTIYSETDPELFIEDTTVSKSIYDFGESPSSPIAVESLPSLKIGLSKDEIAVGDDLEITILDDSNDPVEGAEVTVKDPRGHYDSENTNMEGKVVYTIAEVGIHTINAKKEGYAGAPKSFTVSPGKPYCGDGYCDTGEGYSSCHSDCKQPKKSNGESCSSDSECESGYCIDNICKSITPPTFSSKAMHASHSNPGSLVVQITNIINNPDVSGQIILSIPDDVEVHDVIGGYSGKAAYTVNYDVPAGEAKYIEIQFNSKTVGDHRISATLYWHWKGDDDMHQIGIDKTITIWPVKECGGNYCSPEEECIENECCEKKDYSMIILAGAFLIIVLALIYVLKRGMDRKERTAIMDEKKEPTKPVFAHEDDIVPKPTSKKRTTPKTTVSSGPVPNTPNEEIVVDGSNVGKFGGEAKKENIELMINDLKERGFKPVVIVDASLLHWIFNDVKDKQERYSMWNRWVEEWKNGGVGIIQAPRGSKADDHILQYANEKNLKIVSNDAFDKSGESEKYPWAKDSKRFYSFTIIGDTITWTPDIEK